ncbi:MAG: DUF4878 domain-containing protein [Candidatus Cloacimonadaceae bacterium]|jgi:acyl-CoA reductase-like NAD-dependent aldehyde dehydrogenase|nr:DUF4878 domain-containing protein [Candidatus Cloacimonadota bacterium]MDY0126869.1 DUF4878 domain-containing protein [Candidatus Cloacimonadaceae bacterium]MCB5254580.1 DUF4878 domain-containing protein [Candidatus Cloacimonadota bacterium]MCK9178666.1 DUF4878 domain-containing protein [Candidatus Cloacimonadota bacterium]MCK9241781.1 DUF4878 domain-containing protein [Candidatus Cloacimonadota bacterium]
MKKLVYVFLIGLTLLALTACGVKAEKSAKEFFNALEKQDFEGAKKHTTEAGQQLLTMVESFAENMSEEQKAELSKTKYNILSTVEDGDNAVVNYEQWEEDSPEDKVTHELKMIKIDGAWKVDLAKEDLDK